MRAVPCYKVGTAWRRSKALPVQPHPSRHAVIRTHGHFHWPPIGATLRTKMSKLAAPGLSPSHAACSSGQDSPLSTLRSAARLPSPKLIIGWGPHSCITRLWKNTLIALAVRNTWCVAQRTYLVYCQTMEEYSGSFSSMQYVVSVSTNLSRVLPDYGRIRW